MIRYFRNVVAWVMLGAGVMACPAFGQVSSASRHSESERRAAARNEYLRMEGLFDKQELESMLELGNGSLRGVMAYRERPGVRLRKMLSRPATALADREWVTLFPMTRYVQAWLESQGGYVSRDGLSSLNPEMWKYAGRVRTDRKGYFEFDGLKPGRYLVFADFPVRVHEVERVDTGKRAVTYYGHYSGIIEPVYKEVRRDNVTDVLVDQVIEVRPGVPTTYKARIE